jgi:hypothetical protein
MTDKFPNLSELLIPEKYMLASSSSILSMSSMDQIASPHRRQRVTDDRHHNWKIAIFSAMRSVALFCMCEQLLDEVGRGFVIAKALLDSVNY